MSNDAAKTLAAPSKTQLLALSEDVLVKLPRELRDILYSYLLDPDTLKAAHNKIFPRTASGTLAEHPLPSLCWPNLLRSTSNITETMRQELVVYFIRRNKRLEVHGRACLELLFARNLFDTGVYLSSAAIPSLAIHLGPLEYSDSKRVEDEWNRSAPLLLHGGQRLAHNFTLEVHLQTTCPTPRGGTPVHSFMAQIKDVIHYLDMVIPALRNIKEQVMAKVPGGKVVFRLDFRRMFHTELVAEVREEMVDWSPHRWFYHLRCELEQAKSNTGSATCDAAANT